MSRTRLAVLILPVLLAGCTAYDPREGLDLNATEQVLYAELTRDPFIRVVSVFREEDGWVTITTKQGSDKPVSYRLMPATDGATTITLRRIDAEQQLPVVDDGNVGTGPQPRGLSR